MIKVLMVCTGNTCRSVMAAALMQKIAEERGIGISVSSAGLAAFGGDPATSPTQQVMDAYGIDVSTHRSRRVQQPLIDESDYIFVMTEAHCRQLTAMFGEQAAAKTYVLKAYARMAEENAPTQEEKDCGEANTNTDMDIPDPFGDTVEAYRRTAEEIECAVRMIIDSWR